MYPFFCCASSCMSFADCRVSNPGRAREAISRRRNCSRKCFLRRCKGIADRGMLYAAFQCRQSVKDAQMRFYGQDEVPGPCVVDHGKQLRNTADTHPGRNDGAISVGILDVHIVHVRCEHIVGMRERFRTALNEVCRIEHAAESSVKGIEQVETTFRRIAVNALFVFVAERKPVGLRDVEHSADQ